MAMTAMAMAAAAAAALVAAATTAVEARNVFYNIACVEREWDYAPLGYNALQGRAWNEDELVFVGSGPERIGSKYIKAMYVEYTDSTFTVEKVRPAEEAYLGFLGPVLRASVDDVINVQFRNMCSQPHSMHPHGVLYDKQSEGAPYNDGVNSTGGAVQPGAEWQYIWRVPEEAGPGPNDASSIVWPYHSHTDEVGDPAAGLIGAIIICGRSAAGCPALGVDREFFLLFYVANENFSPLLQRNIDTYTEGVPDVDDGDFVESNLMHSINGFVYGNQPLLQMAPGESVRWYLMALGNENDLHTVHLHGQTLLNGGHRVDTVSLLPAEYYSVDMVVADNPGVWLLHCHVDDHMLAGMMTRFEITAAAARPHANTTQAVILN